MYFGVLVRAADILLGHDGIATGQPLAHANEAPGSRAKTQARFTLNPRYADMSRQGHLAAAYLYSVLTIARSELYTRMQRKQKTLGLKNCRT